MGGRPQVGLRIPQAGEWIAGKYEIDRQLGAGAMGVVMAARHRALGQSVAIKFISFAGEDRVRAYARFEREARAAAGLDSEYIVRVLDFGALDDGTPYLVMQYLVGRDLAKEARAQGGKIAHIAAVDSVIQACAGLAEAHARRIVHRDIKPANLFVTQRPGGETVIKILDFGISKVLASAAADRSLSDTASLIGSPPYMSPEQIRQAADLDHRTDIWSLGVVLYELCTGSRPFDGATPNATLASIVADEPRPLRSHDPAIHPDLDAIVRRCLLKSPVFRYPTTAALAAALAPLASERGRLIARQLDLGSPPPSAPPDARVEPDALAAPPPIQSTAPLSSTRPRPVPRAHVARTAVGVSLAVGLAVSVGVAARARSTVLPHTPAAGSEPQKPPLFADNTRLNPPASGGGAGAGGAADSEADGSAPVVSPGATVDTPSPPPSSHPRASSQAGHPAGSGRAGRTPSPAPDASRRPYGSRDGSHAAQPRDPLDDHY